MEGPQERKSKSQCDGGVFRDARKGLSGWSSGVRQVCWMTFEHDNWIRDLSMLMKQNARVFLSLVHGCWSCSTFWLTIALKFKTSPWILSTRPCHQLPITERYTSAFSQALYPSPNAPDLVFQKVRKMALYQPSVSNSGKAHLFSSIIRHPGNRANSQSVCMGCPVVAGEAAPRKQPFPYSLL